MVNASALWRQPVLGSPRHFPMINLLQIHFREMTVMSMRWLGAVFAIAAALGAQSALAQPMSGCPEGQAIQASDPSGKNIRCVPIPAPVDVSGLQAQINAEAAAREGMDATLLGAIEELREASIVGTYTFTGTQACLNASLGFNPDLTPIQPGNQLSQSTAAVWGFRTFNLGGTGTSEFHTQSVSFGGGSESTVFSNFNWEIVGGKLIIAEGPSEGTITSGGTRVGWTVITQGVPRAVGVLGKDLRIISIVHEEMKPELGITRSPDGLTEFRTPRICHRERTLRKM